jgi:hypothetical protein
MDTSPADAALAEKGSRVTREILTGKNRSSRENPALYFTVPPNAVKWGIEKND